MTDHQHDVNTSELTREEGQTMAEYGITLGIVVLGVVVAIGAMSVALGGSFTDTAARIADLVP